MDRDGTAAGRGVRVVEMTHMVMGPTCGMVLAQTGRRKSSRVEPPGRRQDPLRSAAMGTAFLSAVQPRQKKSGRARFQTKPEDREDHGPAAIKAPDRVSLENFPRRPARQAGGWVLRKLRRQASASDRSPATRVFSVPAPMSTARPARRGRADDVGPGGHDRATREEAATGWVSSAQTTSWAGPCSARFSISRRALPEARRQEGTGPLISASGLFRELPGFSRSPSTWSKSEMTGKQSPRFDAGARACVADLRHFRHRGRRPHLHRASVTEGPTGRFSGKEFGLKEFAEDPDPHPTPRNASWGAAGRIIPRRRRGGAASGKIAGPFRPSSDALNICFSPDSTVPRDLLTDSACACGPGRAGAEFSNAKWAPPFPRSGRCRSKWNGGKYRAKG